MRITKIQYVETARRVKPVDAKVFGDALHKLFTKKLLDLKHFLADRHNWKSDIKVRDWRDIKLNQFRFNVGAARCKLEVFNEDNLIALFAPGETLIHHWNDDEVLEKAMGGLKAFAAKYGYFISSTQKNGLWKDILFEPNYGQQVKVPRFLYHITSAEVKHRILNKGFIPKEGTREDYQYPARTFFAPKYDRRELMELFFAIQCYGMSIEDAYYGGSDVGPAVIFRVDTSKLPHVRFFSDPDVKNAVWTYSPIPPSAISVKWEDPKAEQYFQEYNEVA